MSSPLNPETGTWDGQKRSLSKSSGVAWGAWMRMVDLTVQHLTGLTTRDFPDHLYRDEYDSDREPVELARELVAQWI